MIQFVERRMPFPLGSVDNKRSLLGLGNFADLICLCVENEAARAQCKKPARAKGETFVVSDGCDLSTAELVRKISAALNRKPRLISLSPGLLRFQGRITGKQAMIKRLTESLVIDSTKVRRVLGWEPPYSMEEELARTVEWYKASHKD